MSARTGQEYVEELKADLSKKHAKFIKDTFDEHGKVVTLKLKRVVSTGSRSGRVYSFRGMKYTASAPGEPPAKITGRLADSFGHNAREKELQIYNEAESDDGAPYPFFLEVSTSKMDARPYFDNTITSLHGKLEERLQGFLKKGGK
jgi:hypothetical protein